MKTALILFEQSGVFQHLYEIRGYNSIAVDIQNGIDIFDFDYKALKDVEVIIAHPPCTEFAGSGARWWKTKPPELLENAIRLVEKTLEIIEYHKPGIWFIENPVGRIESCIPDLKRFKKFGFHPHEYAAYLHGEERQAERYTKKTFLWGQFHSPPKLSLTPIHGSKMHKVPPGPDRKNIRSKTPLGFAKAFVAANINYKHIKQLKLQL